MSRASEPAGTESPEDHTGLIVGVVVAVIAVLIFIVLLVFCRYKYFKHHDKKIKKTISEEEPEIQRRPSQVSQPDSRSISRNQTATPPATVIPESAYRDYPSTSPVPPPNISQSIDRGIHIQQPTTSACAGPSRPVYHMIHDPNDTTHLERYGPVISADYSVPLRKLEEISDFGFPGPNQTPSTPTAPPPEYTPVASHTTTVQVRAEYI